MEENKTLDMVNHPKHYKTKSGLETIQVIEAFTEDLTGIEATDTGNIIKYICRWKSKNGIEDLKKARWYLNHLIRHVNKADKQVKTEDAIKLYFEDRSKAFNVIYAMEDIMTAYGCLTMNDVYDLIGSNDGKYADNNLGWTSIPVLTIRRDSDKHAYCVELPKPHILK